MTDTSKFGGYIAVPQASGDAYLVAWWTDGRVAYTFSGVSPAWRPIEPPSYAALWPAPPEAVPVADATEVRYGLALGDGSWLCHCDGGADQRRITGECPYCHDRNPALRPPPHRRAVDRIPSEET